MKARKSGKALKVRASKSIRKNYAILARNCSIAEKKAFTLMCKITSLHAWSCRRRRTWQKQTCQTFGKGSLRRAWTVQMLQKLDLGVVEG